MGDGAAYPAAPRAAAVVSRRTNLRVMDTDPQQPTLDAVRERPGGRSARVREAVIDAVRAELLEGGYSSLSHGTVAKRAGVDRATVYRRWPTRARLTMDALVGLAEANVDIPKTGSLEQDLRGLAASVAHLLGDPSVVRLLLAFAAARGDDPDLREIAVGFWDARLAAGSHIITDAGDRGEIEPVEDPSLVLEMLLGPLYFRALLDGRPIDDAFQELAVARALGMLERRRDDP